MHSITWNGKFLRKLRAFFWPKKSFSRGWIYLLLRILRLRLSAYALAAGLGVGVGVSFTPLIGLHVLLAIALAYFIRGNIVIAIIGTAVGNPWTFPFIWAIIYWIGSHLLGLDTTDAVVPALSYEVLLAEPGRILLSMLLGGAVLGSVIGSIVFGLTYIFAERITIILARVKEKRQNHFKKKMLDVHAGKTKIRR